MWFLSNKTYRNPQRILQCLTRIPGRSRGEEKKLGQWEGFPNPCAFLRAWESSSVCGVGVCNACFSMESHHPASTVRKKAKVFPCPCTATPFHALRIMAQKIKLMSSALFYTGYFCTWEVEKLCPCSTRRGMFPCIAITATASSLPQTVEFRGDFLYFLPFLAKVGQEHSYPFIAGQHFNYAGASQLNTEFLFFQCRRSISS